MKHCIAAVYTNYKTSMVGDPDMELAEGFTAGPRGERLDLKFERVYIFAERNSRCDLLSHTCSNVVMVSVGYIFFVRERLCIAIKAMYLPRI
jgi:hypothetical protein